jgi:hypothetical protein
MKKALAPMVEAVRSTGSWLLFIGRRVIWCQAESLAPEMCAMHHTVVDWGVPRCVMCVSSVFLHGSVLPTAGCNFPCWPNVKWCLCTKLYTNNVKCTFWWNYFLTHQWCYSTQFQNKCYSGTVYSLGHLWQWNAMKQSLPPSVVSNEVSTNADMQD